MSPRDENVEFVSELRCLWPPSLIHAQEYEIPMAELVKIDLLFVKIAPQIKKIMFGRKR